MDRAAIRRDAADATENLFASAEAIDELCRRHSAHSTLDEFSSHLASRVLKPPARTASTLRRRPPACGNS